MPRDEWISIKAEWEAGDPTALGRVLKECDWNEFVLPKWAIEPMLAYLTLGIEAEASGTKGKPNKWNQLKGRLAEYRRYEAAKAGRASIELENQKAGKRIHKMEVAYERANEWLRGTPWQVEPAEIKKAYFKVNKAFREGRGARYPFFLVSYFLVS